MDTNLKHSLLVYVLPFFVILALILWASAYACTNSVHNKIFGNNGAQIGDVGDDSSRRRICPERERVQLGLWKVYFLVLFLYIVYLGMLMTLGPKTSVAGISDATPEMN